MSLPAVVVSLDLELAWGSFDHQYGEPLLARARWTHDEGVPRLLALLCRHQLRATWATVGVVMEDRLPDVSGLDEVAYPHFPKPWFTYVPEGGGEADAPAWFGASLLRMIAAAKPEQELAFHSYSHVDFGAPGTSPVRVQQELRACRELAERHGFAGRSFVFPRNSCGHVDALAAAGFTSYRSPDELPVAVHSRKLRSAVALAADVLAWRPKVVRPRIEGDIVAIPGSLMVRHAGGWRRHIPDRLRARRLRSGLQELCAQKAGVFHVWLHPENLYDGRPRIENVLADFFAEVADLVDRGRIRCATMGDIAAEMLQPSTRAVGR